MISLVKVGFYWGVVVLRKECDESEGLKPIIFDLDSRLRRCIDKERGLRFLLIFGEMGKKSKF